MTTRDIWVISDTHFYDEDMITYFNFKGERVREFDTCKQMDECLMDNWNSTIKPNDIVYHLGDVFFDREDVGRRAKFEIDWFKLHGHKRLVIGNHDDIRYLSGKSQDGRWFFEKVMKWRKYPEFGIFMTHEPIHESGLYSSTDFSKQLLNVHGHIHRNDSPDGPYRNVSVEATNYKPVNIEDLKYVLA